MSNTMTKRLILVVEDNPVLQRVIQLLSHKLDVEADVVSNGTDALTAVASGRPYQVVFMDWRMPDMDGLECTRQIRARESNTGSHLPIVAMTANVMDEDRQACLDSGMDDYMSKPFNTDQFRDMLVRWVPEPVERSVG
jgi:CheY-like chemotaxis protein